MEFDDNLIITTPASEESVHIRTTEDISIKVDARGREDDVDRLAIPGVATIFKYSGNPDSEFGKIDPMAGKLYDDADLFFELMFPLQFFANQQRHILSDINT